MSLTHHRSPASTRRNAKMSGNGLNVDDLLNFSLPPRQSAAQTFPRRGRKSASRYVMSNKERFVNAQYRFVMNPNGDYTVHFADPDIFFQWDDVLQILIPRSSALASAAAGSTSSTQEEGTTTCPICLAPPIAPRMTRCGHVYCFACILRYFKTSGSQWAKCPICFDSVTEKHLRPVKWIGDSPSDYDHEHIPPSSLGESPIKAGTVMTMRLMQRPHITTLALPRSTTWPSDLLPPHQAPFHFLPDVYDFAKFMLATPSYLESNLKEELAQIMNERKSSIYGNDPEAASFLDAAAARILRQHEEALSLETPYLLSTIHKAEHDLQEFKEQGTKPKRNADPEESLPLEGPAEFLSLKNKIQVSIPSTRNAPRQRRNVNPPPPSTSAYYYYQAASGLPVFLHPLDIKILLSHFSAYASFPDSIEVRIEAFSEGSVDDDLRKRCKYLAHLPASADVVFIETDLEGVVGKEGLKNFEGALKMRANRRKEKIKKDDRARARAEDREKTRRDAELAATWTLSGATISQQVARPASPANSQPERDQPTPAPAPQVAGAWGTRSFASALHSNSTPRTPRMQQQQREVKEDEVDWDLDAAWQELEQRNSGGRRKRSNKLVVLGGGGGRRR